MLEAALSLTVLAAIALLAGAAYLWRKPGFRKQALLMIVLAVIAVINVGIWTLPDSDGQSPAGQLTK